MTRTAEAEGKDIYAAAAAARAQLGIGEDEGSMEVLVRAQKGFLGIGSRPARVRVTVEAANPVPVRREPEKESAKKPAPEKKPQTEKKLAPEKKSQAEKLPQSEKKPQAEKLPQSEKKPQVEKLPQSEKKPQTEKRSAPEKKSKTEKLSQAEKKPQAEETPTVEKKDAAPVEPNVRKAQVEEFLKGLLANMDVEAEIIITDREGGGLNVELSGPNMGAVIGRRGETLDAIQHLTNYALNRGGEKHMHISVDAESYRSKREESLVHLAEKMAAKALKYNRSMALEPMNSYERHVIHTALQNYEGVSTASTGTEPNRRVVVSVVRPAADKSEKGGRNSRRSPKAPKEKKEIAPAIEPQKTMVSIPEEELPAVAAPVVEESAAAVEKTTPTIPEGYEPINKNKPVSREWC